MFVNLTPHVISGSNWSITPSGVIARVSSTTKVVEKQLIGDNVVDIVETSFGEVENLPEEQPGVYLVVSALVRLAAKNRHDLLSPGEQVRNAAGQVVGCKNLTR